MMKQRKTLFGVPRPMTMNSTQREGVLKTSDCVNMLYDGTEGVTRPLRGAKKLLDDSALPFFSFKNRGGEYALIYRDGALCYFRTDMESPRLKEIAQFYPAPLCAIEIGEGVVEVMTETGRLILNVNPGGEINCSSVNDYPKITAMAEEQMELRVMTDGLKLSADYTRQPTQLKEEDEQKLTKQLKRAYIRLSDLAQDAGLIFQPVFIRYKLLDANDTVVFCSAPKMIAPAGGFQCCERYETQLNEEGNMNGIAVKANVSRASISIPDYGGRGIEKVVIESSYPLHPADFSRQAETTLSAIAGTVVLRLYMPGTSVSMVAAEEKLKRLVDIYERASDDSCFKEIARFPTSGGNYVINPSHGDDTERQLAAIKQILLNGSNGDTATAVSGQPFTAGAAERIGGKIIFGDLRVDGRRFEESIMVTEKENRYKTTKVMDCGIGKIVGIREMERRRESLSDYTRSRVYLFGTKGIAIAVIGAKGEIGGVNVIDRRGVVSNIMITPLRSERHQLGVIAEGNLLLLNGTKISEPAPERNDMKGIATDMKAQQVWLLLADGRLCVASNDLKYLSYTDFLLPESIATVNGNGMFYAEDTLYTGAGDYEGIVGRLTIDVEAPRQEVVNELPKRLRQLTAEIRGKTKGTIAISCCNVPSEKYVFACRIRIDGDFNSPVTFVCPTAPCRYYRFECELTASESLGIGRVEASFS